MNRDRIYPARPGIKSRAVLLSMLTIVLLLGTQCVAPTAAPAPQAPAAAAPQAVPVAQPAAKTAVQLNFVGWQGYEDPEAFKPLYDSTGIVLNATYPGTLEDVFSLYKAGGPGSYDIGVGMNRYIMMMFDAGMMEPLDESKLPNLKEMLPAFQKADWWGRINGKLYAVPAFIGFDAICYRADKVSEPDWNFYKKDEYKGKYGASVNALGSLYLWAMQLGKSLDARTWTQDDLKQVKDLGMEVFKNAKTLVAGEGEASDLLARGDIVLANGCNEGIAARARKAGADVKAIVPKGPTKMWADFYFVFKGSKNKEAAETWINQAISAQAMTIMTTKMGYNPPNEKTYTMLAPDLAKSLGWPDVNNLVVNAPLSVLPDATATPPHITVDDMYKAFDEIKTSVK